MFKKRFSLLMAIVMVMSLSLGFSMNVYAAGEKIKTEGVAITSPAEITEGVCELRVGESTPFSIAAALVDSIGGAYVAKGTFTYAWTASGAGIVTLADTTKSTVKVTAAKVGEAVLTVSVGYTASASETSAPVTSPSTASPSSFGPVANQTFTVTIKVVPDIRIDFDLLRTEGFNPDSFRVGDTVQYKVENMYLYDGQTQEVLNVEPDDGYELLVGSFLVNVEDETDFEFVKDYVDISFDESDPFLLTVTALKAVPDGFVLELEFDVICEVDGVFSGAWTTDSFNILPVDSTEPTTPTENNNSNNSGGGDFVKVTTKKGTTTDPMTGTGNEQTDMPIVKKDITGKMHVTFANGKEYYFAADTKLALIIGSNFTLSDGKIIKNDAALGTPYVNKEGNTMIPFRMFTDGLKLPIVWNGADNSISMDTPNGKRVIKINDSNIYDEKGEVVGQLLDSTGNPVMPILGTNERTYLPVRAIANLFELKTTWNAKQKTVEFAK